MFLAGEIARREAVSRPLLENAYASFVDQGYLARVDGKLALTPSYCDRQRRRDHRGAHRLDDLALSLSGPRARRKRRVQRVAQSTAKRTSTTAHDTNTTALSRGRGRRGDATRASRFVAGRAYQGVVRSQRAGRVGRAQVTGERKRLAAAAPEVDLAPVAALARLGHPVVAAEAR